MCQNCGSKYSLEEARKLIIDCPVKIDQTDRLGNLYQIAQREMAAKNYASAGQHYDMILIDDPNSIEAHYYSLYCKVMNCKIMDIPASALMLANNQYETIKMIKDAVDHEDEQMIWLDRIIESNISAAFCFVENAQANYRGLGQSSELTKCTLAAKDILYQCGDVIDQIFDEKTALKNKAAKAWENGIGLHKAYLLTVGYDYENEKKVLFRYLRKFEKLNKEGSKQLQISVLQHELEQIEAERKTVPMDFSALYMIMSILFFVGGLIPLFWGMPQAIIYSLISPIFFFASKKRSSTISKQKKDIEDRIQAKQEEIKIVQQK